MSKFGGDRAREFYAETYDSRVPDWPGEIDFYGELAVEAAAGGGSILELACGTGRVALRLGQTGARVVGLDSSAAMLAVARRKSDPSIDVSWVEADMRSFGLGESYRLIIAPGHSFQNLLTTADQLACLRCIHQHLGRGGLLVLHVDHMDMQWLGGLPVAHGDASPTVLVFPHPRTGNRIRASQAWSYEPTAQTAVSQTVWEELDGGDQVTDRWDTGLLRFHCFFRYELEHLLARAGLEVRALYGDFSGAALQHTSSEMIWVAGKRTPRR